LDQAFEFEKLGMVIVATVAGGEVGFVEDAAGVAAVEVVDHFGRDGLSGVGVDVAVDAEDGFDVFGDEGEVVGDHEDGHVLAELLDGFEQVGFERHIEVGGGLVHEEEGGTGYQGAGDKDSLTLSAGKVGKVFVERIRHIHRFECFGDAVVAVAWLGFVPAAVQQTHFDYFT